MKNRRAKSSVIIVLILLIILGVALYFFYLVVSDLYAPSIEFAIIKPADKNQSSFLSKFQFYSNMRFSSNTISYNIDISCNEQKIQRISSAISQLEQETSTLKFSPSQKQKAEIYFSCSEQEEQISENYFVVGEGGATRIVNTSNFYIIEEGRVLLLYKDSLCDNHNIELHELLHVFGFGHSENEESIMYSTTKCNQVLTNDIIEELKRLYSFPSLPELTFSNISAIKHGHYLDFEATVKNQGLKIAESIYLELYAKDKKVDSFDLKAINYGEGRILKAKDITIPRKTSQIKLIIYYDGKELDKENNAISLYLPS